MAVDTPAIREVVERVFARQDVLNACKRRDLSTMITILGANGVTQAEIAALMGKTTQGRLSEYKRPLRKCVDIGAGRFLLGAAIAWQIPGKGSVQRSSHPGVWMTTWLHIGPSRLPMAPRPAPVRGQASM
jgi:hypothetical protein